ncbi:MAG TPA: hypothetical protein VFW82_04445 [Dyella sp.]|nr:hypothetical protein [Dyella sp.]
MFPIDPQWFSWKNLSEEWRRIDVRGRTLRVLTLLVVLWLSINPSLLPLAAYVDSVGIDVALAVFEMQFVVGVLLLVQMFWPRIFTRLRAAKKRGSAFFGRLRVFIAMYVEDF